MVGTGLSPKHLELLKGNDDDHGIEVLGIRPSSLDAKATERVPFSKIRRSPRSTSPRADAPFEFFTMDDLAPDNLVYPSL